MVIPNSYAYNYTQLAARLAEFGNMRFFRTPVVKAATPQDDTNATWSYFDSEAVRASVTLSVSGHVYNRTERVSISGVIVRDRYTMAPKEGISLD